MTDNSRTTTVESVQEMVDRWVSVQEGCDIDHLADRVVITSSKVIRPRNKCEITPFVGVEKPFPERPTGANNPHSKWFMITKPDGEQIKIRGLAEFCRMNGISHNLMGRVMSGKQKTHKGYFCRRLEK
jgi:hypothetical protein